MSFGKIVTGVVVAIAVAGVPVAAVSAESIRASQAVPAKAKAVPVRRAGPKMDDASNLAGAALALVVIAGAAGIAGVVAAADSGNSASN